jgi:hypothetical protein
MIVELLHVTGCPNVEAARDTLRACLEELGLDVPIAEREGDYASPSILINGADAMGREDVSGAACRLDLPTRARILAALASTSSLKPLSPPGTDPNPPGLAR